jgi:hypothetical protein
MESALYQEVYIYTSLTLRAAPAMVLYPRRIAYERTGNQSINHMLLIAGVTPPSQGSLFNRTPHQTHLWFLYFSGNPIHIGTA